MESIGMPQKYHGPNQLNSSSHHPLRLLEGQVSNVMRYRCRCALALLLLGIGGCNNNSMHMGVAIQIDHEPISLDPSLAEDGVAFQILDPLMHGLFGYSSDGTLEARLVESYKIQEHGKKINLTLRPGLKWSDGTPLTAENFVTAFRRALHPSSISKAAPLLYPIQFAQEYHRGSMPPEKLGVHGTGRQLSILLTRATPYFIHLLAHPITLPLQAEFLSTHRGEWQETHPTTGPYRIRKHILNQEIQLEKNPTFWNTSKSKNAPELVSFKIISDESAAIHLFEAGKLDLLTHVSTLDLQRLKQNKVIQSSPLFATYYLSFNCLKFPANNPQWRRQVSQAIQKKQITDALGGGELPASSWIPKGLEGYFEYTPQQPSQLIQTPVTISAGFDQNTRNTRIFEVVQQNLKQTFKTMTVNLAQYDWKSYLRILQTDPPILYRMGWMAPISDPITHLNIFTSGNPNNYSHCASPDYDQLVTRIEGLKSGPMRTKLLLKAQDLLLNKNVAVIPIYHYVQNNAVSKKLKGFHINPFGMISILELRKQ